jgi:hypothetical protein
MVARRLIASVLALAVSAQPVLAQTATVPGDPAAPVVYQPQDKDERGLWMQMDEAERSLKASALVMRDPELNAYVRGVLCKTVGAARCANVRLYIMRTPHFNASMALNGVMQVYSGLLLRTQNEAQLAAVLGHEYAHFERQHSLKLFREIKAKSNSATWLAFTGIGLIASFGLAASIYSYSRDMEREADAGGLKFMADAGYDTREAANVWEQLRAEMDATAAARNVKSRKDKDRGLFTTHPPTAERVTALREQAAAQPGVAGAKADEAYRAAMARWWPEFVEDQFKLNDFGASDYLLQSMAAQGWSPWLLYARGELYRRRAIGGDLLEAVSFYDRAISEGGSLPQLWRGRGLAQLKLGNDAAGKADLIEYMRRAPDAADRSMMAMMAGEQR